jgi:hypothetical protein
LRSTLQLHSPQLVRFAQGLLLHRGGRCVLSDGGAFVGDDRGTLPCDSTLEMRRAIRWGHEVTIPRFWLADLLTIDTLTTATTIADRLVRVGVVV